MAADSAVEAPPQAEPEGAAATAVAEPPAPAAAPAAPEPGRAAPDAPAKAPAAGKAAKQPKAAKGAKDAKKGKDGKSAMGADTQESGADGPSVAAHPRAARAVARAKGWGGLIGFLLGGYMSLPTNTLAAAGLRALVAGLVCYVAVWAGAVFVWRRLVILEIKGREQQLMAAHAGAARRELPAARGERADARARP